MESPIRGLHHVTATADDAQADLDFVLHGLGLRLVKRTVNFDNSGVYHFYYGTEVGAPSTIWTTFPYRGRGVPVGVKGAGQITATSFSVPGGTLGRWKVRLREQGIQVTDVAPRFGEEAIAVQDPSGLVFELVGAERDPRAPWPQGPVSTEQAIRGLHSVTLVVRAAGPTVELLTGLLGFEVVNEAEDRVRLAVNGEGPGKLMDVVQAPDADPARNGLGTVHHVAVAVADGEEQLRLRRELLRFGLQPTEVRDRCYFQSIYFREPGGVLLEIATVEPGFTLDEEPGELGRELKLPPWEEPKRKAIEAALPQIRVT